MSSVTVRATRGQRLAALHRPPVQAFAILLLFIGVAGAAVKRLQLLWMGELFCIHVTVATGALHCGVGRGPQGGRVEGGWHSRLARAGAGTGIVATQARLAPRQRFGLLGAEGQSKEDNKEACRAEISPMAFSSSENHTFCRSSWPIIVEFHSTS